MLAFNILSWQKEWTQLKNPVSGSITVCPFMKLKTTTMEPKGNNKITTTTKDERTGVSTLYQQETANMGQRLSSSSQS